MNTGKVDAHKSRAMENQPKLEQAPPIEELEESFSFEKIKVSPSEYEKIMRSLYLKDGDVREFVVSRINAMERDAQREHKAALESIEEEFNQATASDQEKRDQIKKSADEEFEQATAAVRSKFWQIYHSVQEKLESEKKLIEEERNRTIGFARKEYEQIEKTAYQVQSSNILPPGYTSSWWKEYESITDPAWVEHEQIEKSATEKYNSATTEAEEKYDLILKEAEEVRDAVLKPAEEERNRIVESACKKYNQNTKQAQEKRNRAEQEAKEEYLQTMGLIHEKSSQIRERLSAVINWKRQKYEIEQQTGADDEV